jgi:hypothetical protein
VASPTIFAAMVGVSVLEIVQHLATKEELPIRCWLGSKVENSKAAEAVKTAGALVIESTALSTLFVTGLSKELSGLQSRLIVPRGAFLDLRQRLLELKNAGNRYLTKQGDKYVFIEESNELVSQRIAALEEFISTIESRCEIEDGTALAHMPVVERTRLIQSAGREAAEAIALAQNRGCPIWADDLLVAAAADLFGVQRVWTDFLLQMPDSPWRFSAKSRHHYVAKLAYCGFQFTRLSPQSLLETCQDAKWNLEDARLRLVLKWFSTPELVGELVTAVAWQSLPKIWDKAPNRARAYELTCHLLRNICQRGDAKRILNTLHKQAESVRDADTARAIKTAIEIWR